MSLLRATTLLVCLALAAPLLAQGDATSTSVPPTFVPRTDPPAQTGGNLRLTSVLRSGDTPYSGTVFTVLREEPAAFGKVRLKTLAVSGPHAHADFALSPGRYRVLARNGTVLVDQAVVVPTHGSRDLVIDLNAGELQLQSVMSEHGEPGDHTWFRVYRLESDPYGKATRVQVAGNGYANTAGFLLPAGDYLVEARYGDAHAETTVRVTAGKVTAQTIDLQAGFLEIEAMGSPEVTQTNVVRYTVLREPPDAAPSAPWAEIARIEASATVTFVLPAGRYRVRAEQDRAQAEIATTVEAGGVHQLRLPLGTAEVSLTAVLGEQGEPLLESWFWLEPVDVAATSPAMAEARGPADVAVFTTPAGRYRAIARSGEGYGSRLVDIDPASQQQFEIPIDAGRVVLRFDARASEQGTEHAWFSVYRIEQTASGKRRVRVFNTGYYPAVAVILPPGDYLAIAQAPHARGEQAFTVATGEQAEILIAPGS